MIPGESPVIEPRQRVLPLTKRELEIAQYYADGKGHKAIALITHTTLATIENTLYRVKTKYRNAGHDVHTKADVRACLERDGVLYPDVPPDRTGA